MVVLVIGRGRCILKIVLLGVFVVIDRLLLRFLVSCMEIVSLSFILLVLVFVEKNGLKICFCRFLGMFGLLFEIVRMVVLFCVFNVSCILLLLIFVVVFVLLCSRLIRICLICKGVVLSINGLFGMFRIRCMLVFLNWGWEIFFVVLILLWIFISVIWFLLGWVNCLSFCVRLVMCSCRVLILLRFFEVVLMLFLLRNFWVLVMNMCRVDNGWFSLCIIVVDILLMVVSWLDWVRFCWVLCSCCLIWCCFWILFMSWVLSFLSLFDF